MLYTLKHFKNVELFTLDCYKYGRWRFFCYKMQKTSLKIGKKKYFYDKLKKKRNNK